MNCNREEAMRAKELAEAKFTEKNYALAKKLALKAQTMWPELEGISQFLDVVDVFVSSEVKVGDLTDWYNVLSVSPTSDEDTIKKRYKKMALSLHPDKNQSLSSTDAFKIMAEAFDVLSDQKKRSEYDAKRSLMMSQNEVKKSNNGDSLFRNNPAGKSAASEPNFPDINRPATRDGEEKHPAQRFTFLGRSSGRPSPYPTTHCHMSGLFWTKCARCDLYHEYGELFRGKKLMCASCFKNFVANMVETPPGELSDAKKTVGNNIEHRSDGTAPSCSKLPKESSEGSSSSSRIPNLFGSKSPIYRSPTGHGEDGLGWPGVPETGSRWWSEVKANFPLQHQQGFSFSSPYYRNNNPNVAGPRTAASFFPGSTWLRPSFQGTPTYRNFYGGQSSNYQGQQMNNNMGPSSNVGSSFYRPHGFNSNLGGGSNPSSSQTRTEESTRHSQVSDNTKRPFEGDPFNGGQGESGNKKRNVGTGSCRIFGKTFPSSNNDNDPGSGSSCNNADSSNKKMNDFWRLWGTPP